MPDVLSLQDKVMQFVAATAMPEHGPGRYRYSVSVTIPTLYSSCYAVMILSLLDRLNTVPQSTRTEWIDYLQSHQDSDGLFRDPVIYDMGWYKDDPLWCGRPHLSCHVLTALACLGATASKPLTWLEPWLNVDRLQRWLAERDWGERVAWTGNEIANIGILLQYARDFHNDDRAGRAVQALLEWLSTNHINSETGLWGYIDISEPQWLSHAVQAAYHWWVLFFYDNVPVPYMERAIDLLLKTQNPEGGFGWGVHNSAEPFKSSACEDMDSIDPLCRMACLTDYRKKDIVAALAKAVDWVLTNQMPDGGFVFYRDRAFEYGHPQLRSDAGQSGMMPTWFRLLSLALLAKALPEHPLARLKWHLLHNTAVQFWFESPSDKEKRSNRWS